MINEEEIGQTPERQEDGRAPEMQQPEAEQAEAQQPQAQDGLLGSLGGALNQAKQMLDQDGDGSPLNDLGAAAQQFLKR